MVEGLGEGVGLRLAHLAERQPRDNSIVGVSLVTRKKCYSLGLTAGIQGSIGDSLGYSQFTLGVGAEGAFSRRSKDAKLKASKITDCSEGGPGPGTGTSEYTG